MRRPRPWIDDKRERHRPAGRQPGQRPTRRPRRRIDEDGAIIEPPPMRCPECGSDDVKVTKTLATVPVKRYRLCRACGVTFKTVAPD